MGSHVTGWRLTIYRAYLLAQLIYLQFLKVQKFFDLLNFSEFDRLDYFIGSPTEIVFRLLISQIIFFVDTVKIKPN